MRYLLWCFSLVVLLLTNASIGESIQSEPNVPLLLSRLKSSNPRERMEAYYAILKVPNVRSMPKFVDAIVELAILENQLTETTLRESQEKIGISDKYGEDFSFYTGKLVDTLQQVGDTSDQQVLDALVNSAYDPTSKWAAQLTKQYGPRILPAVLIRAKSDISGFRSNSMQMLGTIAQNAPTLSVSAKSSIRTAVIAGCSDVVGSVRADAATTLGNLGNASDIALLIKLAQTDSYSYTYRGVTKFPAREQAQRSIDKIQRRTSGQ